MKKPILIGSVIVVILALAGSLWSVSRDKKDVEMKYASTQASKDSLQTHFDAALVSIAEIQDSLTAILPSENQVMGVSNDVEHGGRFTATRKDQVLRTISDLNTSIQRSKDMISRLEENLKDRDVKVASLERIITGLKKTVSEREQMIASLSTKVDGLQVQVASLQTDVEAGRQQITQQAQVIEDKRKEIATVHYVVGTKRHLKELGVVRDTGGLAGLGKTTKLSGQFPEQVFANLDTDTQTTIQLNGKNPTVISGQSNASYQIVPINQELSELRITNPEEFRKVRYLVVRVS